MLDNVDLSNEFRCRFENGRELSVGGIIFLGQVSSLKQW
jgi:hypothetical protein